LQRAQEDPKQKQDGAQGPLDRQLLTPIKWILTKKYDKQDQQGKAAFNERNPHMTQQQEPMARSPEMDIGIRCIINTFSKGI
jgi:hypothetical protein